MKQQRAECRTKEDCRCAKGPMGEGEGGEENGLGLGACLTNKFYSENIQPILAAMSASAIARRISVSRWYAGRIREGYRPHPSHWKRLAELIDVTQSS